MYVSCPLIYLQCLQSDLRNKETRIIDLQNNVKSQQEEAAKAKVVAKVVAHGRGEKVRIFKMRRRKHYQKRQGHRQNFTQIEILSIA